MAWQKPIVAATVVGLPELERTLSGLTDKVKRRVIKKALRKAAKPIVTAARTMVPVRTRLLKRSIGTTPAKGRKYGAIVVVGPRRRFKGKPIVTKTRTIIPVATKYAHLVEKGTRRVEARRFMAQAYRQSAAKSESVMREEMRAGVLVEARK